MIKLTKRQNDVLNVIKQYISDNGFPPTTMDIAIACGFKSPNAATQHLDALLRKGAIKKEFGVSRGISLVAEGAPTKNDEVPIIGKVGAGVPVAIQDTDSGRMSIDRHMFTPSVDYFLSVAGDSMKDIGVVEGDLLAVHGTKTACNGQVVVARCNNQISVKRFYQQGSCVKLVAENADYPIISFDLEFDDFSIDGIVVGVIRQYES